MASAIKNLKVEIVDAKDEEIPLLQSQFKRYHIQSAGPGVKTLVAKSAGQIVGYLQIDESQFPSAKISCMEVNKDLRGKRVGSTLLGSANSYLLSKKAKKVITNPDIMNDSLLFWRRTNYRPVGDAINWVWIPKSTPRGRAKLNPRNRI